MGFRVGGGGFEGLGFVICDKGLRVCSLGLGVRGFGFMVQGSGSRDEGLCLDGENDDGKLVKGNHHIRLPLPHLKLSVLRDNHC